MVFSKGQACLPAEKDGRAVTTALQGTPGEFVTLTKSQQLCSLWQVDRWDRTRIIPVGRSYNGHDWEPYGGGLAHLKFACDETDCAFRLPEPPNGFLYELVGFDYELPDQDLVARFLEQSTFGPTRQTIASFPDSFAAWIQEQQESVPMTSHRRLYRQNVVNRLEIPRYMGVTTTPCEKNARYHRYAFTSEDAGKPVEIFTDPATRRRVLLMEGVSRTVLPEKKIFTTEGGDELKDGE